MSRAYKSYNFKDKDPIIDVLRTALQDDGIEWKDLPEFSGVSYNTYYGWFEGATREPKNCTIQATVRVLPVSTQRLIWKRCINLDIPEWKVTRSDITRIA